MEKKNLKSWRGHFSCFPSDKPHYSSMVSWFSFFICVPSSHFFGWCKWWTKSFDNLSLGDGDYGVSSFAMVSLSLSFISWKTCKSHFGYMTPVNTGAMQSPVSRVTSTPNHWFSMVSWFGCQPKKRDSASLTAAGLSFHPGVFCITIYIPSKFMA